jgi:G:T/U-mismatch repair DNA glycosylase
MIVGQLFQFTKYIYMLYPTKEFLLKAIAKGAVIHRQNIVAYAALLAAYWSNELDCTISYVEPYSIFCLLEQDGEYVKILASEGTLGWIYLSGSAEPDIEKLYNQFLV